MLLGVWYLLFGVLNCGVAWVSGAYCLVCCVVVLLGCLMLIIWCVELYFCLLPGAYCFVC